MPAPPSPCRLCPAPVPHRASDPPAVRLQHPRIHPPLVLPVGSTSQSRRPAKLRRCRTISIASAKHVPNRQAARRGSVLGGCGRAPDPLSQAQSAPTHARHPPDLPSNQAATGHRHHNPPLPPVTHRRGLHLRPPRAGEQDATARAAAANTQAQDDAWPHHLQPGSSSGHPPLPCTPGVECIIGTARATVVGWRTAMR